MEFICKKKWKQKAKEIRFTVFLMIKYNVSYENIDIKDILSDYNNLIQITVGKWNKLKINWGSELRISDERHFKIT